MAIQHRVGELAAVYILYENGVHRKRKGYGNEEWDTMRRRMHGEYSGTNTLQSGRVGAGKTGKQNQRCGGGE